MKLNLFLPIAIYLISACSTNNYSNEISLKESPEDIANLLSNELLLRSEYMLYQTPDVNALHYAEVCAAYGAIKLANQLNNRELMNKLIIRYDTASPEYIPNSANHVDANVYGVLPLEIYMHTKNSEYLAQGIVFADGQWNDTLPGGYSSQIRYWIDDIYMIGCLQVQAYRATNEILYLERAASVIDSYITKLQQTNGLFYHGSEAPIYWARGNGWVVAGLAELLSVLPDNNIHYSAILRAYQKMMKTLLDNQSDDGMWHQVINKPKSFKETSSTAMFGFAMALGVKNGFLPKEPYTTSYIKAWNALIDYINEEGRIKEVCIGTGQSKDLQYYFDRPRVVGDLHGQAPMLWFAGTLIAE